MAESTVSSHREAEDQDSYISVMSTHHDNNHTLFGFRVRPPSVQEFSKLFTLIWRKEHGTCKDSWSLWVKLEDKLGDDAKVGSTAPDAPEEVRVLGVVGDEGLAVGGHDCYL